MNKFVLVLFLILSIFLFFGCTQSEVQNSLNPITEDDLDSTTGELVVGTMTQDEINSFFDNLRITSYTEKNSYFSKKDNSLTMKSILYFQFNINEVKFKITSITPMGEKEIVSDTVLIGTANSQGELGMLMSSKMCMDNPMGGSRMCMDLTDLGEDITSVTKNQSIDNKTKIRESITKYLGTKQILGIEAKCFEANYAKSTTSIVCYHPEYFISLENNIGDNQTGSIVKATALEMGSIPFSEFEIN